MVYVFILFLSLLAGAATAGFVWYAWGFLVNLSAYRQFKAELAGANELAEETEEEHE